MLKKTIILSKNGAKGYVTVVRVGGSVGIKVVLDSFEKEMTLALKLGANGLIIRTLNAAKTEFELHEDIDFKGNDDISCLVLRQGEIVAEGGARGRIQTQEVNSAIKMIQNPQKTQSTGQSGKTAQNKEVNYGNGNKEDRFYQQTQRVVAKNRYENPPTFQEERLNKTAAKPNISREIPMERGDSESGTRQKDVDRKGEMLQSNDKQMPDARSFYFSVKDRLDELFVMYPREELLERIIPSSKWVRINYDKEDFYVAGVLIDEGAVTHIAYGVPGYEGKTPPKETECICDWLPIKNMPRYQGYWLIFQSADTGEILPKD